MNVYGKLIKKDLNVDIKKRAGGTYKGYRLQYEDEQGEIKPLEKTMQSLKFTPSVEASLNEIQAGDDFTLSMEKNDAGFWDVKSLSKGKLNADTLPAEGVTAKAAAPANSTTNPYRNTGKVVGSTYETPEERKLKQRLIVRQSSFAQALQINSAEVFSLDITFKQAEEIENWVYRGLE